MCVIMSIGSLWTWMYTIVCPLSERDVSFMLFVFGYVYRATSVTHKRREANNADRAYLQARYEMPTASHCAHFTDRNSAPHCSQQEGDHSKTGAKRLIGT